jgi:hypothetical protein
MIEIPDPTTLEYDLTDLFWWWWYDIHIAGYTRIGTGVTLNISVQTDEESKCLFFGVFFLGGGLLILSPIYIFPSQSDTQK